MGAGASKPSGALRALGLRPRRDPKPTKQEEGAIVAAASSRPAAAAAAALAPAPPAPPPHPQNDDPDPAADADAYARTCAALERVLEQGVRAGARSRPTAAAADRRPPPPARYSAKRAHAAERRAARAFDAANGLPLEEEEDDDDDEEDAAADAPTAEAAAIARAALGLSEADALPQRCYWAGPPVPGCEPQRLQAMEAYGLLADAALPDEEEDDDEGEAEGGDEDNNNNNTTAATTTKKTPPANAAPAPKSAARILRPAIESALKLVRGVFGVDEALVALFGDRRVFIRDASGLFEPGDFPWRYSFCYWTLAPPTPTALVVRDVRADARFSANSVARRAGVRFYCGVPLIAPNGHRLGVLCFASRQARPDFDAASVSLASNLAELVARELAREAQLAVARRVSAAARLRLRDMAEASAPVLLVERRLGGGEGEEGEGEEGGRPRWVLRHANGAWIDLVSRARRAQRVRSGAATAASAEDEQEGGGDDPFGGALGADLWGEVFEPPPPALIAAATPPPSTSIPGDSATSLPSVRFGGGVGGGGAGPANGKAALQPLLPLPPPQPSPHDEGDEDERLFAMQAPFSVHGARLRRPPFGRAAAASTPCSSSTPSTTSAPAARVTLRFVPAAAPGALGPPPGAQLTAAPASLPDLPLEEAQRRRLAALWFVDVEPEPLLQSSAPPAPPPAPAASSVASSLAGSVVATGGTPAEAARPGTLIPGLQPPVLLRPSPSVPLCSSTLGLGLGGGLGSSSSQQQQLPPSLAGLVLGAPLASGSFGRVFRGRFRAGERVAVKVLDPEDVGRCDEATGAALEATLGERLRHPNVVQTLAWGVVEARSAAALPPKPRAFTRRRTAAQQEQRERRLSSGVGRASTESASGAVGGGGQNNSGSGRNNHNNSNNPFAQAAKMQAFRHGQALSGSDDDDDEDEGDAADAIAASSSSPGSSSLSSLLPVPAATTAADAPPPSSSASSSGPLLPPLLPPPPPPPPKQTWLVLEYCDRGNLQEAIDAGWLRTGRDPRSSSPHLPALLATAREVAGGMAHLHRECVVHGDLSAYNVLLASGGGGDSGGDPAALGDRGWTAKIADFGLAKTQAAAAARTTRTYGTVTHQAPEVLYRGKLSFAADVYSYGVLLWSMWTGARPWRGLSHAQVVRAVALEGKGLLWPDDAPGGLAVLGEACLSRDPQERPTFGDVLEVLDPLVDVLLEAAAEAECAAGRGGGG